MPIPTVRLHLDELFSIIKDGPDPGDEPDLVGRTVSITLTPRMDMTAVVPVEGDPHGYLPETLKYLVGPPILERDPVTGEPVIDPETEEPKLKTGAVQPDMDWPFSVLVANLADPAMLTDATQYSIVVETVDAPRHTSNRKIPSGVDLKPEDTGATIDLMPLLPMAAATPTSPVVKGDTGDPGPPGPVPVLSAAATTLAPGSSATATFSGDPAAPLLTVGIPRGDKGDPGNPTAFQLRGPGRPDQPATTDGVITGSEAVGTEFVSLDGAGVGAWVWRKRPSPLGWQVTDLDTGTLDITHLLTADWNKDTSNVEISRRNRDVTLIVRNALRTTAGGGRGTESNLLNLPTGFRLPSYSPVGSASINYYSAGVCGRYATVPFSVWGFTLGGQWAVGDRVQLAVTFRTPDPVPPTLTV